MKVRAGTGVSTAWDAATAGYEAARAAVAQLSGEPPALAIVYTCTRYDLPALLAAIRVVTGAAPLMGATSAGNFAAGGYSGVGAGVAVLALTAGGYRYGIASRSHVAGDLDGAAQELARASRASAGAGAYGAIVLLVDGVVGDLQQLVQGVYRVTGPRIPMVGGVAADERAFVRSSVFHDDAVLEEGAVALWIASEHPLQVVTRHGWVPIGVPMLVSRAGATEISELGGRPAADAYTEQLGLAPGELNAQQFWDIASTHPLALLQPDGSLLIRATRGKTERGGLLTPAPVPVGCAVQVMSGSVESLLSVVSEVPAAAFEGHPGAGVLLAFSCGLRAIILGERTCEESQRLQAAAGDVPTFGFYTYGEFARSTGVLGAHNATLTALAL